MTPNHLNILERCLDAAIARWARRCFKHDDAPIADETSLTYAAIDGTRGETLWECFADELCQVYDFEDRGCPVVEAHVALKEVLDD